eukprot:Hpha_TRINITY_DN14331_c0_g1::TRINITY_DN14331_c0_g1_i1::g.86471::m.86471
MKVVVGTQSKLKVGAVEEAFRRVHPGVEVSVVGVSCASGINEQPVGHPETLRGARNRLAAARAHAEKEGCELACAIENGIFKLDGMEQQQDMWFDLAWVVCVDVGSGKEAVASSTGVQFPNQDVRAAMDAGFETTTVGSKMKARVGCDGADPHTWLTAGAVSRRDMLTQALSTAFGSLKHGG